MIRRLSAFVAIAAIFGFVTTVIADDFEKIPADVSQGYAQVLSTLFQKTYPDVQAKFEVDPSQATGIHAGQDGVIVVPMKGLKEGDVSPSVETEIGAGLCHLYISTCFVPIIDGKPIETKKLRTISVDDGQGGKREAFCLVVTVKHVNGDDWRLYGYGTEKTPVVNSQFVEAGTSASKPLDIRVINKNSAKANLELTLHNKYAASFSIGIK
jgi:hypothetical protein